MKKAIAFIKRNKGQLIFYIVCVLALIAVFFLCIKFAKAKTIVSNIFVYYVVVATGFMVSKISPKLKENEMKYAWLVLIFIAVIALAAIVCPLADFGGEE